MFQVFHKNNRIALGITSWSVQLGIQCTNPFLVQLTSKIYFTCTLSYYYITYYAASYYSMYLDFKTHK